MRRVFADTSYYLALWNVKDVRHAAAVQWSRETSRLVLLTEFVLLEVANAVSGSQSRRLVPDLVRHLRRNPRVTILAASQGLLNAGLALYAERPDKDWSLTDCISFVVMREHGSTEALTTDHHFGQAGFKALLT